MRMYIFPDVNGALQHSPGSAYIVMAENDEDARKVLAKHRGDAVVDKKFPVPLPASSVIYVYRLDRPRG